MLVTTAPLDLFSVETTPSTRTGADEWPLGTRGTISIGGLLSDLVLDSVRGRAYVADRLASRVLAINLGDISVARTIQAASEPVALAISPSGQTLYVGHAGERSILAIDLSTFSPLRTLTTEHLVWDLAVPTEDSIVMTTHDDQWTGRWPRVLNATSGEEIGRLCDNWCNTVYQDEILALNANRTLLAMANARTHPFSMILFQRSPDSTGWSFVGYGGRDAWGSNSGEARELTFTGDGTSLYVAANTSTVSRFTSPNFGFDGFIGPHERTVGVQVSPEGSRLALVTGAGKIALHDASGAFLVELPTQRPVSLLRVTEDGSRFVAVIGTTDQDVEVFETTGIAPVRPRGVHGAAPSSVQALVASFRDLDSVEASVAVDGDSIEAALDTTTGSLSAIPDAVGHGDHTVDVTLRAEGTVIASSAWNFTVLPDRMIVHEPKHFSIQVPETWTAERDAASIGGVVDLLLQGTTVSSSLTVSSGTLSDRPGAGLRNLYDSVVQELMSRVQGAIHQPEFRTLDDHTAITGVILTDPRPWPEVGYGVRVTVTVIAGPEWDRYWVIVGRNPTSGESAFPAFTGESIESFRVLPAPPPQPPVLLAAGSLGIALIASGLTVFLLHRKPGRGMHPRSERS